VSDTQTRTPATEPVPSLRGHVAHPEPRDYVRIFFVLLLITLVEVSTYYVKPPRSVLIPVLLTFTIVKFTLVVLWFMHLKFDSRLYARLFLMGIAFALTLYLIVLLIFGVFS
jgi:cytochrome c oxidase subunit IV